MMIEDKILLTARYVEGDLNETEKADFENRLLSDDELHQHLTNYHDIHQSLAMELANHPVDLQFKATLEELNKQYFVAEPKVISFKPLLKWASGIAAILVVA
jgi:negative regulator of sigma E activity